MEWMLPASTMRPNCTRTTQDLAGSIATWAGSRGQVGLESARQTFWTTHSSLRGTFQHPDHRQAISVSLLKSSYWLRNQFVLCYNLSRPDLYYLSDLQFQLFNLFYSLSSDSHNPPRHPEANNQLQPADRQGAYRLCALGVQLSYGHGPRTQTECVILVVNDLTNLAKIS